MMGEKAQPLLPVFDSSQVGRIVGEERSRLAGCHRDRTICWDLASVNPKHGQYKFGFAPQTHRSIQLASQLVIGQFPFWSRYVFWAAEAWLLVSPEKLELLHLLPKVNINLIGHQPFCSPFFTGPFPL